ncbi:MAG: hypothetical protein J6O55_05395 [Lachnospiraceae bacterium]|nr:hypothetical protein [Lachnospiraceae bacterium]
MSLKEELLFPIERLYRSLIYPFKRLSLEKKTRSILSPGSYIKNAKLCGRNYLGRFTAFRDGELGYGSYINHHGDFTHAIIGRYTSIGAYVSTAVGSHPLKGHIAMHPAFTDPDCPFGFTFTSEKSFTDSHGYINIGNDVWIGNNVLILDGAEIGDGAVVGAGAVVAGTLPPYSISVGVPAKPIRYRFSPEEIEILLKGKWWERDEDWIREHIKDFSDPKRLSLRYLYE